MVIKASHSKSTRLCTILYSITSRLNSKESKPSTLSLSQMTGEPQQEYV